MAPPFCWSAKQRTSSQSDTTSRTSLLSTCRDSNIWAKLHVHYTERYPNISRLVNILRVMPYSNALAERCFSTMKKIKTDWRASLETSTLDKLIRIKKMDPDVDVFTSMLYKNPVCYAKLILRSNNCHAIFV